MLEAKLGSPPLTTFNILTAFEEDFRFSRVMGHIFCGTPFYYRFSRSLMEFSI